MIHLHAFYKIYLQYDIGSNRSQPGSGGEYSVQVGFGWTNGVALDLLRKYGHRLKYTNDKIRTIKKRDIANGVNTCSTTWIFLLHMGLLKVALIHNHIFNT